MAAVATTVEPASMLGQPTVRPSSGGQLPGGHSLSTGCAPGITRDTEWGLADIGPASTWLAPPARLAATSALANNLDQHPVRTKWFDSGPMA